MLPVAFLCRVITNVALCRCAIHDSSQIKSKYGEQGLRVFKVLGDEEEVQMEQRTIAEKALIVEKVAGGCCMHIYTHYTTGCT